MTNKIPLILILTFLTLAIAGSFYLFIQKGAMNAPFNVGQNQQQPTQSIQPQPVTPQSTTLQAQPTSVQIPKDWKMYRNEKMKFEIQYPPDWVLKNQTLNSPETEKRLKEECIIPDINIDYEKNILVYSAKPYLYKAKTLDEFVHKQTFFTAINKILFAGYPAYEMTQSGCAFYYTIIIDKDGEIYTIKFGNHAVKADLTSIDKKMLSTFKFLK